MKFLKKERSEFKEFSEITQFRLINLIYYMTLSGIIFPLITSLEGQYLNILGFNSATVISFFFVFSGLVSFANGYLVDNLRISTIFKLMILIHIITTCVMPTYFYNITAFVVLFNMCIIAETVISMAYSISLSNFITYFENDNFPAFQNMRVKVCITCGLVADATSLLINMFYDGGVVVITCTIMEIVLVTYMFTKIKLFTSIDKQYRCKHLRLKLKKERKLNIN